MKKDKQYTVSVPVPLIPFDEHSYDTYVQMLKRMDADRVFIFAPPMQASYIPDLEEYRGWSDLLRQKIAFFNGLGMDAAFWMGHTIGHGGDLSLGNKPVFQQLVGPEGKEAPGCFCPLDEKLRAYMSKAISIMAESGVELIMLDDDFRVNLHPPEVTAGCFCPLHLKAFREKTGLTLSREEIVSQALSGKPNEIRQKWLELHSEAILRFAGDIEQAVHQVNRKARIGIATAMTLWSNEGLDMQDLLKRFAGGTRLFLRTIGAPYWSKDPSNISWVVEYSRLQKHWTEKWDVELMSEGDGFPHTRYHCPAVTLHAFQQGLFAAGFTGILNYALIYAPHPEHEPGYVNKVAESLKNYAAICRFFPKDYRSVGVQPALLPNNMMAIVMPDKERSISSRADQLSWADEPVVLRMLGRLGIPVGYEGSGPAFLSGYGAAGLPAEELDSLLAHGAVVDAAAARWLVERGVDIGISGMTEEKAPAFEKHTDPEFSGEYVNDNIMLITGGERIYYNFTTVKGGNSVPRIISEFRLNDDAVPFPAVILYENAKKQRFCVLAFDIYNARNGKQLLWNYARQEQLTRCLAWVNRKALPVSVNAVPDAHVMCRVSADGKRMAVAVQNCNLDAVVAPVLRLDPHIQVGQQIELLLPDADEASTTSDFTYKNDGIYGYLALNVTLPAMGLLGVGLVVS
jgi:hypothetical protein